MAWYEKYPKLLASEFTYERAGMHAGLPPPYREVYEDMGLHPTGIVGEYGTDQVWKVVGYTTDPPFRPKYDCVAIMFEDQVEFEKVWWHFSK